MVQAKPVINVDNVVKYFKVGVMRVGVLKGLSLDVSDGEFVIMFGPSGCGKSTFLHILLGLELPSSGFADVLGFRIDERTKEDEVAIFRNRNIGIVYQLSHWIHSMKVLDNVAFPLYLQGKTEEDAKIKAHEMLELVEMSAWSRYYPTELSAGQQQRVALARAMINNPKIIIADEPTGNMDYESGEEVMDLLKRLNKSTEVTILMVTHDLEYVGYADRAVRMLDGQVVDELVGDELVHLMHSLPYKKNGNSKN